MSGVTTSLVVRSDQAEQMALAVESKNDQRSRTPATTGDTAQLKCVFANSASKFNGGSMAQLALRWR
jgi:hypothetical protein